MFEGWKETTINIPKGEISINGVRAYVGPKTGKIFVMPNDVIRAEMNIQANALCLQDRDITTLMMLYAKPEPFQEGYVHYLYNMNKMLFYLYKKLEEIGFGDALPHDEIEAIERGPRPKHLKDDLRRLEQRNIIKVNWPVGNEKKPISISLTYEGLVVAKTIWENAPDLFKKETLTWKRKIFPMSPGNVMKMVHEEYPEWKKDYTKPDTE